MGCREVDNAVLSSVEVMKLGAAEALRQYRLGNVGIKDLWRCSKQGALEYARAVASGDVASDEQVKERGGVCGGCCSRKMEETALEGVATCWCGPPLVETGATCGCLVGVTVRGVYVPGAKLSVGSQACPRGLWGPEVDDRGPNG
jgi:hypothetical protein